MISFDFSIRSKYYPVIRIKFGIPRKTLQGYQIRMTHAKEGFA